MPYTVFKPSPGSQPLVGIENLTDAVKTANEEPGSQIHNGKGVIATSPTTVEAIQAANR